MAPGSNETTTEQLVESRKLVIKLNSSADKGLMFRPLDIATAQLVLFTDAAFFNSEGLKSQLGLVLSMVDASVTAKVIQYGSTRCVRISIYSIAAEVFGLVYGFDQSFSIQQIIFDLMGKRLPIEAYTDSNTLFDIFSKQGSTTEIYIDALK